jgi:hypothetical protein
MSTGQITRKEIIEDEALRWGEDYAKLMEKAIGKNKEFVESILALNEANKQLRASGNQKELAENQRLANVQGEKALGIWKEQNQLELALISTKRKNLLATESTNRALVKERTALAETNKEIKAQAREQLGLIGSYEKLNKSRNDAQKRLGDLLSAEKKSTAEVIKAQLEFNKLDARVKAVDASLKNYSKNIGNYQSAFQGLGGTLRDLTSAFGIVTGIALFGQIVGDITSTIREFDRQLIAVGKTTNISGKELEQFGREVVQLGSDLDGVSVQGLLSSAEVAGQLGVKGTENILKFSTAIEKLKLTSDIITEEQVQSFAQFIEVSADSFENADKLASVITQLGNNFATTEAQILSNATEIQKGIAVYATSAEGVLGLGAATASLGSEAESSRSAIQSTFAVINNAIATGKNLQNVLKLTGLTQAELSKQFNKDATGVFVKFVGGLAKAKEEGQNLTLVLNDLDITEKRAFTVVGSLAANYDVLANSVATATEEYKVNEALNREVVAASESINSILSDINDQWEAFVLSTNDANDGTKIITNSLKFLRDNLQTIIANFLKYGAVVLTFVGVMRIVNFTMGAWTALQGAATAAQINFALATGIGTKSILAQAAAVRAATTAQTGLNVAMTATPWGIVLAALAAAVIAYKVFNDELNETEIRTNAIKKAVETLGETEAYYAEQRTKGRDNNFKQIEDEIALRKAQGENSDKLDKEEIARKKAVTEAQLKVFLDLKAVEIERTKTQIEESNKRVAVAQNEVNSINKFALSNPFGESNKEKEQRLIQLKAENDARRATLQELNKLTVEESKKLNKVLEDLDKQKALKDAETVSETNEKLKREAEKRRKEYLQNLQEQDNAEFKLREFRLKNLAEIDRQYADSDLNPFDQRLDALLEANQLELSISRETAEQKLKDISRYTDSVRDLSNEEIRILLEGGTIKKELNNQEKLVLEQFEADKTKIVVKGNEDREKLVDNQVKLLQKGITSNLLTDETELNKQLTAQNKLYKANLQIIKDFYAQKEALDGFNLADYDAMQKEMQDLTTANEQEMFEIKKEFALKGLKMQISAIEALLKAQDALPENERISAEKRAEIENQLSKAKLAMSEEELKKYEENADDRVNIEEETTALIKQLSQDLYNALGNFVNAIFEAKIANIDNEIAANDEYYAKQIELAGNDQRQKDLLTQESEKKRKKLEEEKRKEQRKQAIFNKATAIAEIGINTAAGIMATIKNLGLPFATPFVIATGLLGALQVATVLATPIPKYEKGTKNHKGGFAEVGEVRPEVIIEPGKKPYVVDKPSILNLKRGTEVVPSIPEYEAMMRASYMASLDMQGQKLSSATSEMIFDSRFNQEILEELKLNRKATERQRTSFNLKNEVNLGYEIWRLKNINW